MIYSTPLHYGNQRDQSDWYEWGNGERRPYPELVDRQFYGYFPLILDNEQQHHLVMWAVEEIKARFRVDVLLNKEVIEELRQAVKSTTLWYKYPGITIVHVSMHGLHAHDRAGRSLGFDKELTPEEFQTIVHPPAGWEQRDQENAQRDARDVLLGTDLDTDKRIYLPYSDRNKGVAITGKSGTGKSSLLEHMILADLLSSTPAVVFDPHRSLVDRLIGAAPREYEDRIIVLDPKTDPVFGLNILACDDVTNDRKVTAVADSLVATVKKIYGQAGNFFPRLEKYIHLAARTLIPNRFTAVEIPVVFSDENFRETCLSTIANVAVQRQLRRSWAEYERLRSAEQAAHIESVINRFELLISPQFMQQMLGSGVTTVPFERILRGHDLLIVDLEETDEFTSERADLIGAMILEAISKRVFRREKTARSEPDRLHLYIDEYHRFATATTTELLTQGRKFGAGVTLAYQVSQFIRDETVRGAELQARSQIVLNVAPEDAERLAPLLSIKPMPERIDWIDHPDATEDIMIPTSAPIEYLRRNGHSNRDVVTAAQLLFGGNPQKPVGEEKHVDNTYIHIDPKAPLINKLLLDAMRGELRDYAALECRLFEVLCAFATAPLFERGGGIIRDGHGRIEGRFTGPDRIEPSYYHYGRGLDYLIEAKPRIERSKEEKLKREVRDRVAKDALKKWLRSHLVNRRVLQQNIGVSVVECFKTQPLHSADRELLSTIGKTTARKELLSIFRERLRCLLVLCEGLAEKPILVPSGDRKPRKVQVSRPAQTYPEAVNEVVAKILDMPAFTGYVKLVPPGRYNIALTPPLTVYEIGRALFSVRQRSVQEYKAISPEESGAPPSYQEKPAPPDDKPGPISRRSPKR